MPGCFTKPKPFHIIQLRNLGQESVTVLIGHSRKKFQDIEHHSQKTLSILFQTLHEKKKKKNHSSVPITCYVWPFLNLSQLSLKYLHCYHYTLISSYRCGKGNKTVLDHRMRPAKKMCKWSQPPHCVTPCSRSSEQSTCPLLVEKHDTDITFSPHTSPPSSKLGVWSSRQLSLNLQSKKDNSL